MYKYLEAWKSAIPKAQASQVVGLLTDMRDKGIIKTEQEFREALNRLTGAIKATDPVPLSKLFPALLDQYIDSESYDWMIDKITSDLVSGFAESQKVEDLLVAHQKVYEEYTLAKLKQIIGTIEEQIALHQLLNNNPEGFSNLQYNTFTQNARSTNRSSPLVEKLFYDKSARKSVDKKYDAVIDVVNEALELPGTPNTLLFTEAREVIVDTTETNIELNLPTSATDNAIDGRTNTFYIKPFLVTNLVSGGCQLRLRLDCGALRPINYLELRPVADYPFTITAIHYVADDGATYSVELQDVGLLNTEITRPVRFFFTEVKARYLYLTAVQENYTLFTYNQSSLKEIPRESFEGTYLETDTVKDIISSAVKESAFLQSLQDLFTRVDTEQKIFQYVIGFDNIWTGRISYRELGIFVSEPLIIKRCRRVGLSVDEADTTDDLANQRASFEYWIYKQDYNDAGSLIGMTMLPILPIEETEAYERLHLTELTGGSQVANTATLRFQGHWGGIPDTVKIYQNGVELEYGTSWSFTDEAELGVVNYTRITIEVPQGGEIYTARYTPVQYLPGAGTDKHYQKNQPYGWFFGASNIIRTVDQIGSEPVAESDIYLIIILKHNNNLDRSQSPRLNEYSLLTASQDPNRLYD